MESGKICDGFKLKLALFEGCKIPTLSGEVGNLNTLILDWKLSNSIHIHTAAQLLDFRAQCSFQSPHESWRVDRRVLTRITYSTHQRSSEADRDM